jgi:hypothetical protein
MQRSVTLPAFLAAIVSLLNAPAAAQQVEWEHIQIDSVFRSEGVAVADLNRNGKLDVIAGDVWYEAPDWTMRAFRPVGEYDGSKGYSRSFANFAYDVNGDGWDDIIVIGFPGEPCHWYENPKGDFDGHWKEHVIWHSAANETPLFTDLTGDGKPELVFGSEPERQMGFLPLPPHDRATSKWDFQAISEPGDPRRNGSFRYYHGLGVGDVNNSGRSDVLIPHGWWEQPEKLDGGPWTFHPWTLSADGTGDPMPAADLHVYDLTLNGVNDVIMSSPHAYGIWWFENVGSNEAPRFRHHVIDDSFSQTHALALVDINGNGTKDLVTGKRYFAHQGNDPGGRDPVVMYWYEIRREKGRPPQFIPHEIVAGRDTGIGTQFVVRDVNGDGLPDIVLSNKKGVNILLQRRPGDR